MIKSPWLWLLILAALIAVTTARSPLERVLGANGRIVYLHGAWVWAALVSFLAAALLGLGGLLARKQNLQYWSRASGRAAILLWVAFLPMSLYIMQANWNGLFFSEPRWRIPFSFAIAGLLLQVGLSFFPPVWASVGNILFAGSLFIAMQGMENVLHPVSPIRSSGSLDIKLFFGVLLVLLLLSSWQFTRGLLQLEEPRKRSKENS